MEISKADWKYRWVFGFGRTVKIMGPSKVVEEYRKHLIDTLLDYK